MTAELAELCAYAQCTESRIVFTSPEALGDTYEEVMESLHRIARACLLLEFFTERTPAGRTALSVLARTG